MRVWERGSGETAACGTGACAAVVAGGAHRPHRPRASSSTSPAATSTIEWRERDDHVYMPGEAVEVFRGEVEV